MKVHVVLMNTKMPYGHDMFLSTIRRVYYIFDPFNLSNATCMVDYTGHFMTYVVENPCVMELGCRIVDDEDTCKHASKNIWHRAPRANPGKRTLPLCISEHPY